MIARRPRVRAPPDHPDQLTHKVHNPKELAPHRTARFRAFAAELGLRELVSIHPLAHGRCATAVIYLYKNLFDLENAYPGENRTPLRRAVAREPSIDLCAPRPSKQHDARLRSG